MSRRRKAEAQADADRWYIGQMRKEHDHTIEMLRLLGSAYLEQKKVLEEWDRLWDYAGYPHGLLKLTVMALHLRTKTVLVDGTEAGNK